MLPESVKLIVDGQNGPLSHEELVLGEIDQETLYVNPELVRLTTELQCALDIVRGAKTIDERKKVYEILMSLGKFS
ncbi:MAG: hypothetical protein COA74_13345 [Gammaproteobacteria bacterium]|nr:MAG: hypothetical protein COA74_13345 [Gammaproteobacteria bacterium]